MAIGNIKNIDPSAFLEGWNPIEELSQESITPSTLLIHGDSDRAHTFAAEVIAKMIGTFPNMPLFVIPATPKNAEGEIDKTTEVMAWLADTRNRGENPHFTDIETPIPLIYLSNVTDIYSESGLARMVKRARFLGLVVVAVAEGLDPSSTLYSNITGMFTHIVEV